MSGSVSARRLPACFAVCAALAAIATRAAVCRADTVALEGKMRTHVDFVDRFVVHVPGRVPELTVALPIPARTFSTGGLNPDDLQLADDVTVSSSVQPSVTRDEHDGSGNLYRVLHFRDPAPGDISIAVHIDNLELSADLDTPIPDNTLPLRSVPADVAKYLKPTALTQSDDPVIQSYAARIVQGAQTESEAAQRIGIWLTQNLSYGGYTQMDRTDAVTTLETRAAICEGWAHLFIALAKADGIPARFVGGYTIGGAIRYPISDDGLTTMTVSTQSLPHAWVELWYPGAGWVPYEPQGSAGFVDTHHIRVWAGPDANSVLPLLSWTSSARDPMQLSFAEEETETAVRDHIAVVCASSRESGSGAVLLTRD